MFTPSKWILSVLVPFISCLLAQHVACAEWMNEWTNVQLNDWTKQILISCVCRHLNPHGTWTESWPPSWPWNVWLVSRRGEVAGNGLTGRTTAPDTSCTDMKQHCRKVENCGDTQQGGYSGQLWKAGQSVSCTELQDKRGVLCQLTGDMVWSSHHELCDEPRNLSSQVLSL